MKKLEAESFDKRDFAREHALRLTREALESAYGSAQAAQLFETLGLLQKPESGAAKSAAEVEDLIARDVLKRIRHILHCPIEESLVRYCTELYQSIEEGLSQWPKSG